jgi:ATP-dependent Zn protease
VAEFQEAVDRVIAGPERKSRVISPREKEITAYHEAGHALVAWMLPHADPVHKVSIVARGSMGGYTRLLPEKDRYLWTKNQFEDLLAVSMGGRVAEEIIFGDITTGASNDLENATRIALSMVKRYAMMDRPNYQHMPISNVISEALSGNVDTIEVYGDDLLVRMKDGRLFRSRKEADFSVVEFFQKQSANGASNDVRVVVKEAGSLGALGPRVFGKREELVFLGKEIAEERDYGDKIAEDIDKEVAAIMKHAYEQAEEILATNKAKLVQIARHLIQRETVEGEELRQLFNSPVPEDIVEQAKHLVPDTPQETRAPTPSVSTMPTTQQPAPTEGSNNN